MSLNENMLWTEKWRPHKIADCIIPDALKASFQEYVNKGEIPNLILSGSSGTGKTTVARAMCDEIGADYILLNGSSNDRGVDTIKLKVPNFASSVSLSGGRKVIIMDEADGLTSDAQDAFRGAIEEFASHCSFIFTCNFKNRLIPPIHSRCAVIDFRLQASDKQLMAAAFFKRVINILKNEKVEFDAKVIVEIITKFFPDYRRVLNELQRYSVGGKIDVGLLAQVSDATIDELVKALKAKDFKAVRKWAGSNSDLDSAALMRNLYDRAAEIWTPESLPVVVVITAKYLFQSTQVMDQEVNTAAWLTEIMVEAQCL
jgi:DNA polymerase III delta prime subunit